MLPLFPQYSSAATGSALEKTLSLVQKLTDIPAVTICNSFYDHPGFINAWKAIVNQHAPVTNPDMWIFSYHGLPVRHLKKRGCNTNCSNRADCGVVSRANYQCYRRQCFATSQLLAQALGLSPQQYRIGFQSRLGRTPWIKPYTDHLLPELAKQGVKHLAVVCPSFVTDCLETLEEIGIRARQQWHSLGGAEFTLLPCLNSHPAWVECLSSLVQL